MQQQSNQLRYEAPLETFKELYKNYFKENNEHLLYEAALIKIIYDELQQKQIYLTSFISQGAYGMVFEAKYQNEFVAVKCVTKPKPDEIKEEVKIQLQLKDTPYVCQPIKEFYSEDDSKYYQISKKYSCNLKGVMQKLFEQKETLELSQIVGFASQMATVFGQMKQKKIIHSDIKPQNILYDSITKSFSLCDFGVSKIFKDLEKSQTSDLKGANKKYSAPENFEDKNNGFSVKYDIYGLGLILLEMTLGKFLEKEQCREIRNGELIKYISKNNLYSDLNQIIYKMLQVKSMDRIDPFELIKELADLRLKLENQFFSALKVIKINQDEQKKIISKFSESFVQIDCDYNKKETRFDKYCFRGFQNLPDIQNCLAKKLVHDLELDFYREGIGQNGAKKVSDALSKCSNITQLNLNLQKNNIDENGAKSISDALKNCKSMIQLELGLNDNKIGREGAISIASALENNQNINQLKLWLYGNNIGDDGAKSIANVIRIYQNIYSLGLNLGENSISDDGAKSVANAIQNCQKITHLELWLLRNNIGDDGAKSVANAIQNCKQITYLDLSLGQNKIGDDGAKSVANAILNCQQITELLVYLSSNKIGDSGAQSIVNAIQNCQKITSLELYLQWNNISQGQKQLLKDSLTSKFGGIQKLEIWFG